MLNISDNVVVMMKEGKDFAVRINTLKISKPDFLALLEKESVKYSEVDFYDLGVVILDFPKEMFTELELYTDGLCYIQTLSSQVPVIVLDPRPGERVLDICAAPGGKTLQIADHMKNLGEVVGNDVSRNRLFKMKALVERYGATNIITRNSRGEQMWRKEEAGFDRVLVDAPCSMNQELPAKKIKSLAKRQRALLHSAYTSTKPGGVIVYSTCTNTKEENEEVVQWMLEREDGASLEDFDFSQSKTLPKVNGGMLRIETDDGIFEPFFIAKFRKEG